MSTPTTNTTEQTEQTRQIAATIRKQITGGVLMSLAARGFGFATGAATRSGNPGLIFVATVLPFTQNGTRAARPRTMVAEVTLNSGDLYDIVVYYRQRGDRYGLGEPVIHEQHTDVPAEALARVMLSIDSDNDRPA